MKHFASYTASHGEHREYKVSFRGRDRVTMLQKFLATLGAELDEQSIYMEYGENAWLVYSS